MGSTNSKVILVIPAYNEEKTISYVIQQAANLKQAGILHDFVVIDDGSEDKTADIVRGAGAKIESMGTNRGKGRAFLEGLLFCKRKDAEVVLSVDGDVLSGLISSQVLFMLDELANPTASGKKTMMVVYPTTAKQGVNKYPTEAQENSGFRAIRMEAFNFLFAKDNDGLWLFSNSPLAHRFRANSDGFRLELELNHLFDNSFKLLPALQGEVLCLPTFRDTKTREQLYNKQTFDHAMNLAMRRNDVAQKLKSRLMCL